MNNNINSIYNIPYSPEYNPIEKIFNTLKTTIRNNKINNVNSIERFIKTKCTKELLTKTIKSIYN
jgi:transposase